MSDDFTVEQQAFVAQQRAALAALGHPVWAVADVPLHGISAFEQQGTRGAVALHAVGQVRLSVHSMTPLTGPVEDVVRAMLAASLFETSASGATTQDELRTEIESRIAGARERAAAVAVGTRTFQVDLVDVEFEFATLAGLWVAAADHNGVRLAVMSVGVAPEGIALAAVADPAAHLPE
jgi:hypothetical protein